MVNRTSTNAWRSGEREMKAYVLLPFSLVLYFASLLSGFVHEGGHTAMARWLDVEVIGFSPIGCLLLICGLYSPDPLEGPRGKAMLFAGGLTASL